MHYGPLVAGGYPAGTKYDGTTAADTFTGTSGADTFDMPSDGYLTDYSLAVEPLVSSSDEGRDISPSSEFLV